MATVLFDYDELWKLATQTNKMGAFSAHLAAALIAYKSQLDENTKLREAITTWAQFPQVPACDLHPGGSLGCPDCKRYFTEWREAEDTLKAIAKEQAK